MRLIFFLILLNIISCKEVEIKIDYPEGGYKYLIDTDKKYQKFYYAPIKDSILKYDSIRMAFYEPYVFRSFDEPNLSLKPKNESIFRFTYGDALGVTPDVVITLKENEIIIKKRKSGWPYPELADSNLNEIERYHYNLIESYYILDRGGKKFRKIPEYSKYTSNRLDSLVKKYPMLLDSRYHISILEKSIIRQPHFTYTTSRIYISKKIFKNLVDSINSSGYWKLPVFINCTVSVMDGDGFSLEAITPLKYNVVMSSSCENNAKKFSRACQLLVKAARLDKEIKIW